MGSTRLYSVRYNNKRIYEPVTGLDRAVEHWESLIWENPLGENGFGKPRPVRLF